MAEEWAALSEIGELSKYPAVRLMYTLPSSFLTKPQIRAAISTTRKRTTLTTRLESQGQDAR